MIMMIMIMMVIITNGTIVYFEVGQPTCNIKWLSGLCEFDACAECVLVARQ